jgi:hypothetical protein
MRTSDVVMMSALSPDAHHDCGPKANVPSPASAARLAQTRDKLFHRVIDMS